MRFGSTIALSILLLVPAAVRGQEPPAAKYVGRAIRDVTIDVEGKRTTEPALVDLVETRVGKPLLMSDVRETIAHFHSLGRFEDIQVDVGDSAGGVDVHYQLEPIHSVSRVEFKGDLGVSEGSLRDWMSSRFGPTPSVGRASDVASTLVEFLHDHGYMTGSVQALPPVVEHNPNRTVLVFNVTAGPLARIRNAVIEGTPLDPKERVLALISATPGRPYDRAQIRQRLADYVTKMRRRGYYQATATDQPPITSDDGGQVDLTLTIFPGPLVKVQFDGDAVPKDKLADMVPIEREGSVDEDLLEDSSRRIEEHLRQQGYYKARVTHERLEQDGTLTVVFHIRQDHLYRVAQGGVDISGNQTVPVEEFRPFIKISAGEPFVSAKLDALAGAIKQLYQRRGFANVAVASGVNEVGEGLLNPTIVIKEGSRVLVGTTTIEGNHTLKTEDLLRLIESRAGEPFYAPTVATDREKIRVAYLNTGFTVAQVTVSPVLAADGAHADLPFKVDEGFQTVIDHILIVGNTRTDPAVIRRELQFSEGQPLGQEALIESQRRLSALGLFRRVRIAPLQHGSPTNPDVIVSVEEALRTTIGYGGGVEIDKVLTAGPEGEAQEDFEFAPRGFFEIGRRNLWGRTGPRTCTRGSASIPTPTLTIPGRSDLPSIAWWAPIGSPKRCAAAPI